MKKNKILFPKKVALLLGAAAVLLLGSTVGSTRAALTYYSENYSAQMNLKHIGVSLVENGQVVSSRDYVSGNEWSGNTEGKLLANMLGENEKFTPGKQYDEAISVTNSGDIDTFVRVIITKSWKDKEGRKNAELSPDLIELNVPENSGWVVAKPFTTGTSSVSSETPLIGPPHNILLSLTGNPPQGPGRQRHPVRHRGEAVPGGPAGAAVRHRRSV